MLILRADELADDAASAIKRAEPSYVVIERAHAGETLRYAYPAEEVITRAQESVRPGAPTPTLLEVLALHEYQSSPAHPRYVVFPLRLCGALIRQQSGLLPRRATKLSAVVPEGTKPFTTQELIAMAAQASTPATDADRIVRPPRPADVCD